MTEAGKKTNQEKLAEAQRNWLDNQDNPKALKALLDAEERAAEPDTDQ